MNKLKEFAEACFIEGGFTAIALIMTTATIVICFAFLIAYIVSLSQGWILVVFVILFLLCCFYRVIRAFIEFRKEINND